MLALLIIKVFRGVTQGRAGHSSRMLIQERQQFLPVHLTGLPQHPSGGRMDQILVVVNQHRLLKK